MLWVIGVGRRVLSVLRFLLDEENIFLAGEAVDVDFVVLLVVLAHDDGCPLGFLEGQFPQVLHSLLLVFLRQLAIGDLEDADALAVSRRVVLAVVRKGSELLGRLGVLLALLLDLLQRSPYVLNLGAALLQLHPPLLL